MKKQRLFGGSQFTKLQKMAFIDVIIVNARYLILTQGK